MEDRELEADLFHVASELLKKFLAQPEFVRVRDSNISIRFIEPPDPAHVGCIAFSPDGRTASIYISPTRVKDGTRLAEVLLHELCHLKSWVESRHAAHGTPFQRVATEIGLAGAPSSSHANSDLAPVLRGMVAEIAPEMLTDTDRLLLPARREEKAPSRRSEPRRLIRDVMGETEEWLRARGFPTPKRW